MEEQTSKFEIYATLPRDSSLEFLRSCKEAGATGVRIHTAKMTPDKVVNLMEMCYQAGLKTMVDLPGIKGRTKKSPEMVQDNSPGEVGNWFLPLQVGDEFLLIPESSQKTQNELPIIFSSVVPEQLEVGDSVEFADGKITCSVTAVQRMDEAHILTLRVQSISKTRGIYWNMGFSSSTKDLLSGHSHVITDSDEKTLREIAIKSAQDKVDKVAVSFVSHPSHLRRVVRILGGFYQFDLSRTSIAAKIETLEAVKNIQVIAEEILLLRQEGITIIVEIGRGDLGDDCKAKGRNLAEVQEELVTFLQSKQIPVIIATGVASSTIRKFKAQEAILLDRQERKRLIREALLGIMSWMLAAETMITGDKAVEVIQVVTDALIRAREIREFLAKRKN